MKSTGLFGKNSGRVGGVVYSNYRGQQIVRSYQPQVKNPNSKAQIEQRAKFKLVSQVGASIGREIAMSFVPNVSKETPRNAFIKKMLKEAEYSNHEAVLPLEKLVLTNSTVNGFLSISSTNAGLSGTLSSYFGKDARVRIVVLIHNVDGTINVHKSIEPTIVEESGVRTFAVSSSDIGVPSGYSYIRALAYVYEPMSENGVIYEDYELNASSATLEDFFKVYKGGMMFSETRNVPIVYGV